MPSDATKISAGRPITDAMLFRRASAPNVGSNARFATQLREMSGPYRARNPSLVGSLYASDGVARLLPKRGQAISRDRPLRVLVANWGHLGDVVIILPLLRFLEAIHESKSSAC